MVTVFKRRESYVRCLLTIGVLILLGSDFMETSAAMRASRIRGGRRSLSEIVLSYLVIDAGVGYSTLLQNSSDWSVKGNVGAQLGVGYEMRIHGFWLSTGIDFQYYSYTSKLSLEEADPTGYSAYDTQGKPFHMKFYFDKMSAEEKFIFANIPLMFGFYHRSDFYLGVGVRLGHTAFSLAKTTLNFATTGEYGEYISDFANIPPHGFNTLNESVDKNNIGYKFRCTLVGEIGYDILSIARQASKADRNGLKIGAFVEYGLTNMVTATQNPIFYFDNIPGGASNEYNALATHSIPYLTSEKAYKAKVFPIYFGIKFSWMFEMNTNRCRTCW